VVAASACRYLDAMHTVVKVPQSSTLRRRVGAKITAGGAESTENDDESTEIGGGETTMDARAAISAPEAAAQGWRERHRALIVCLVFVVFVAMAVGIAAASLVALRRLRKQQGRKISPQSFRGKK
jgi:hypothetical protein